MSAYPEMRSDLLFKQSNELRVHVSEIVRNP